MDAGLKPCFLVAAPTLECPFFHHTVVLLVDHREDGSLGFVVNKPADVQFADVLEQVGLSADQHKEELSVMMGGPVSPHTGWVVFDPDQQVDPAEGVLRLGQGLGVSANIEMLEEIAKGSGPERFMMMLGYSGWGPGQLDDEIREGAWVVVDLDPKLVFETPVPQRWSTALAQLGIDPARMTSAVVADA